MTILQVLTFGPLRVFVDTETGRVVSVQDALTGCAASLLYSQGAIATASRLAHQAWASTFEFA
jgi:hypothetical protein